MQSQEIYLQALPQRKNRKYLPKCQLSMKIEEIIKSRGWTQQQAAEVL